MRQHTTTRRRRVRPSIAAAAGCFYDLIVRALAALLALCVFSTGMARAEEPAPVVVLYTMGPGADLFSAFGHAAICVHDARTPEGRCYNYGTADFATPLPLTWAFVRGRALFWVSVLDLPRMLAFYRAEGRAVWRQVLPLEPPEARALADALEASTDERVKYYRYHHFNDNCTTRIRDLVDAATHGALRRDTRPRARSFRAWARRGFAGNWPLLAVTELVLGRSADRRTDSWTAMFLPSELRAEVASRLKAEPVLVIPGEYSSPTGATWLGDLAFALAGLLFAAIALAGARVGPRALRLALVPPALVLGLVALVLDALAILSTFPELTRTEALLAFWPTDALLPLLNAGQLRLYARVRLIVLAAIVLLHLGLFTQPLSPLLVAAPVLAVCAFARAKARAHDRDAEPGRDVPASG